MKVEVSKSNQTGKKYKIVITYKDGSTKTIHIGQAGADDYTKTGDEEAKNRYIARHKVREDWNKSGVTTRGFWSKHLLWNEKTLQKSARDIHKRFGIDVSLKI